MYTCVLVSALKAVLQKGWEDHEITGENIPMGHLISFAPLPSGTFKIKILFQNLYQLSWRFAPRGCNCGDVSVWVICVRSTSVCVLLRQFAALWAMVTMGNAPIKFLIIIIIIIIIYCFSLVHILGRLFHQIITDHSPFWSINDFKTPFIYRKKVYFN